MKVLGDINLEELMGEEFALIVRNNPKFGFDLTLIDEDDNETEAKGVHPDALENFSSFCRHFLSSYRLAVGLI